jgi:hypothetical protein
MYTQYSVVVQAFNRVGAGPMSDEVIQHTGEGTPEQAPQDVTCTALTSQSIRLSWTSPPLTTVNGIIKGYKVIYGPSHIWFGKFASLLCKSDEFDGVILLLIQQMKPAKMPKLSPPVRLSSTDCASTPTTACKFWLSPLAVMVSNPYLFPVTPNKMVIDCIVSMNNISFITKCLEIIYFSVPGSPSAVKALLMTPDSILVSWKAPELPNGIVNQYTVYIQEGSVND